MSINYLVDARNFRSLNMELYENIGHKKASDRQVLKNR
jgi:hypothetical protein